jgi:hypothetical protein
MPLGRVKQLCPLLSCPPPSIPSLYISTGMPFIPGEEQSVSVRCSTRRMDTHARQIKYGTWIHRLPWIVTVIPPRHYDKPPRWLRHSIERLSQDSCDTGPAMQAGTRYQLGGVLCVPASGRDRRYDRHLEPGPAIA